AASCSQQGCTSVTMEKPRFSSGIRRDADRAARWRLQLAAGQQSLGESSHCRRISCWSQEAIHALLYSGQMAIPVGSSTGLAPLFGTSKGISRFRQMAQSWISVLNRGAVLRSVLTYES